MKKKGVAGIAIVLGIVTVVLVTYVIPRWQYDQLLAECKDVQEGNGIEGAAIYDSTISGIHPVMLLNKAGVEIDWSDEIQEPWRIEIVETEWNNLFEESWQAKSISEVQLVGYFDLDYTLRSIIPYDDGYELHRIIYHIEISLYEAKTGNLVNHNTFVGEGPDPKIDWFRMFSRKIEYEGGTIPLEEAINWLESYIVT